MARCWKYSAGTRPHTVTVFEREPGGALYARAWDPTTPGGRRRRSLGHRDRDAAKVYALEQAAKLRKGTSEITQGVVRLSQVFSLYKIHRTPKKSDTEQLSDARRTDMWKRFLGADKDPHTISLAEWERFTDLRMSGAIDAYAKPVPLDARKHLRTRSVSQDLEWLRWVLNWASKWRTPQGQYLMRENPVRGYEIPREKNPRRPVATEERYRATRAVTDLVTMDVNWSGKIETVRSHLSEVFDITHGTGRRLSAVLKLRYEDLKLAEGPYGAVRWPAATDKTGRETVVPIGPDVRAALDRIISERPGIGAAYLFPAPGDATKPVARDLASKWLKRAEEKAGLEKLDGSLWHAYRRKWATERKHLPDADVAAAGGWANANTLRLVYQQSDAETMLRVVLERGELREAK